MTTMLIASWEMVPIDTDVLQLTTVSIGAVDISYLWLRYLILNTKNTIAMTIPRTEQLAKIA